MAKYRKKPGIIEAEQWQSFQHKLDIKEERLHYCESCNAFGETHGWIDTMRICSGDWVIKDSNGKLSICKPDIFEQTYEKV